ncbi:MAG: diguanylate cyclase [Candidatus Hydrogenedentes bacterium]|nr:diguanylate cyclase [Candidatus Hydrogenedentota bacterium]
MRILIAEDDAVSRRILEAYLRKWGHDVVVAKDGAEAWECLQREDAPRLALLDWMMPAIDGVEVCKRVRARDGAPFTYLLLLTAKGETGDIVTALDAGADDYLIKPYNADELRSRIGAGERIVRLHEELELANAALRRLSQTDFLTQVSNRSAIVHRLEEELSRSARTNAPLAVFLLDVDHFKRINDTYGHAAGDAVLIEVARRLKEQCRTYDATGRYGGEEFVVIAPGPQRTEIEAVGERVRKAIAHAPFACDDKSIDVTVSVGGVWIAPGVAASVDVVLRRADELLYQAKHAGRNCIVTAGANDDAPHQSPHTIPASV